MRRALLLLSLVLSLSLASAAMADGMGPPGPDAAKAACGMWRWDGKTLKQISRQAVGSAGRATGDLPAMTARGFIRFGVAYSPTFFFFKNGQPMGSEFALAEQFRQSLNAQRKAQGKPPMDLVFITMTRDKLIPALLDGQIDIVAAGLTVTPERRAMAEFTAPYLDDVREWIVTDKKVKGLRSLDDLAGRTVYVRRSSSYYASLQKLNERLRAKGLEPVKIAEADENLATEDILEMVSAGIVHITAADSHLASLWAQALPGLVVHRDLAIASGGKLAWLVRPDNHLLKAELDGFMASHLRAVTLRQADFKTYCRAPQRLKNPLAPKNRRRYEQCKPYITKYAMKTGMDPLLVAALAFVESGFNPRARSPRGAVGVMQLSPGLTRGRGFSSDELQDPETNIRLGVNYLAHIRDNWLDDPDIDADDRMCFALAAYNAGPRWLGALRDQARRMGKDPNSWFLQSEVAAHHVISDHSVQFVRRVNKIYAAFKLDERRRQEAGQTRP